MSVEDTDLDRLWDENRIAIHFPGEAEHDSRSLDPNDYAKSSDRQAIRCFGSLATNGGYVWAEHRSQSNIKIGKIMPQKPKTRFCNLD